MKLTDQAVQDFTKHVLEEYPKEACGLVINDQYIRCTNVHPEPTKSFRIAPEQMVLEQAKGPLSAVLHSHPYKSTDVHQQGYRPEFPSASDIDHFNSSGVAWGIVATDGGGLSEFVWLDDQNRPPLYGRLFIWGVQDCYSLVRDWYKEVRGINLYNVPRQWGWWNDPAQSGLIENWFQQVGFEIIPAKQATIGDIALMRMGDINAAGVINHFGIISNDNELFHQGSGPFYSRACRLDRWSKSIAKYARYSK